MIQMTLPKGAGVTWDEHNYVTLTINHEDARSLAAHLMMAVAQEEPEPCEPCQACPHSSQLIPLQDARRPPYNVGVSISSP